MNTHRNFPAIAVRKYGTAFEAHAALILQSILKGTLLVGPLELQNDNLVMYNRLHPQNLQARREGFLQAISAWPEEVVLELALTALPDITFRPQGSLCLSLHLRVMDATDELAKEGLLARYIALIPLLQSFFTEAEFIPVSDAGQLQFLSRPFQATHALAVSRREEQIDLSKPIARRVIGLLGQGVTTDDEFCQVLHRYPWLPSGDDWSALIDTLMHQLDPVQVLVRLSPAGTTGNAQYQALEKLIHSCEVHLADGTAHQLALKKRASIIRDVGVRCLASMQEHAFRLGVYILAPHPIDMSLGNVLGRSITRLESSGKDETLFQGGFALAEVSPRDCLGEKPAFSAEVYSLTEAAAAFRLPSPPIEDKPGLPLSRCRTALAMIPAQLADKARGGLQLFINCHQQASQEICVTADDRMRHMFIIGQTGTGKSTLMEHMILQDIEAGHGLAVIDPHGEMVDEILGKIQARRIKDVIFFDLLDREYPIGFNILQWGKKGGLEERDLIIDDLYVALDRIYDMKQTGGPIFETNFRGMLKLLMGDRLPVGFTPTLLDFPTCYLSREFRQWLLKRTDEPLVHDFVAELEKTGGEAALPNLAPYITSKLGRFIHDWSLMNIIGQQNTAFDFDDVMNTGKILLVKLAKGRFGSTTSALLASQLVLRFKNAAMRRGEMRPEKRRDFYLYIDECHNLPSENFNELLAEARKYRMGLVLATQYAAQLEDISSRKSLLSAIVGNVGTMAIFRVGNEDAEKIGGLVHPNFNSSDIMGLPNYQGYTRFQLSGTAIPPFSFKTILNKTPYSSKTANEIRRMSRQRYGVPIQDVQDQIEARRKAWHQK